MLQFRRWLLRAAVGTACAAMVALSSPALSGNLSGARMSREAAGLREWVRESGDAAGRPFAIVDKNAARIYIYDAAGELQGQSPALLGSTIGDHIVPGVGMRAQLGQVGEDERTTPAGRFESQPGRNDKGEHVVWVDYESAFAIHRLRPGFSFKARADRLATALADDKRVSWGCVVVPVAFYENVVQRVLGDARGVVYVMPEAQPLRSVFHALESR
jgi:hypothetical protein